VRFLSLMWERRASLEKTLSLVMRPVESLCVSFLLGGKEGRLWKRRYRLLQTCLWFRRKRNVVNWNPNGRSSLFSSKHVCGLPLFGGMSLSRDVVVVISVKSLVPSPLQSVEVPRHADHTHFRPIFGYSKEFLTLGYI